MASNNGLVMTNKGPRSRKPSARVRFTNMLVARITCNEPVHPSTIPPRYESCLQLGWVGLVALGWRPRHASNNHHAQPSTCRLKQQHLGTV